MTSRGRTLAVLAVAMLVFGRLAGLRELVMSGAAFALMLGSGAALVWLRGGRARVVRTLNPDRTSVSHPVRVELTIEVSGWMGSGPVLVADRLPAAVGATRRLHLEGRAAGSSDPARRRRTVAYTVSPRMRGRHQVGPVEMIHTDPLGAIQRRVEVPGTATLLVYPSYEDINALPAPAQRVGAVQRAPNLGPGDEFYSLRAYEEGDDLRKVHWPSTLKTGDIVVRQDELLAEPRALVVLDTTASKHRGRGPSSSLEAAVSACASLGILALRRRMRLDVVTADGSLFASRPTNRHELLEALAGVSASRGEDLVPALGGVLAAGSRPAFMAVITPGLLQNEIEALALCTRRASAGAVVRIDASSFSSEGRRTRARGLGVLGLPVVSLRSGDSFRQLWTNGVRGVALAR